MEEEEGMDKVPVMFMKQVCQKLEYADLKEVTKLATVWHRVAKKDLTRRSTLLLIYEEWQFYAIFHLHSSPQQARWRSLDEVDIRYVSVCAVIYNGGSGYHRDFCRERFKVSREDFDILASIPVRPVEILDRLECVISSPTFLAVNSLSNMDDPLRIRNLIKHNRFNTESIRFSQVYGCDEAIESFIEKQARIHQIAVYSCDLNARSIDLLIQKLAFRSSQHIQIVDGAPLNARQANRLIRKYLRWLETRQQMVDTKITITIGAVIGNKPQLQRTLECTKNLLMTNFCGKPNDLIVSRSNRPSTMRIKLMAYTFQRITNLQVALYHIPTIL